MDCFSQISEAALGSVLLGLQGTLHTFESPPRTFQTSGACWGSSLVTCHHLDHFPSQSAWACWRAGGEVWQWEGRAWWWSGGWFCWWSGSRVRWSSWDPNSCGFHFLSGNRNVLVQSRKIILMCFNRTEIIRWFTN